MLDEGLEIGPLHLFKVSLARFSIQLEKDPDRPKRTLEGAALVVQAPLVPQVILEVRFGGEIKMRELLQKNVNRGLCSTLFCRPAPSLSTDSDNVG